MSTVPDESLEARIARLERLVESLERRLPALPVAASEPVRAADPSAATTALAAAQVDATASTPATAVRAEADSANRRGPTPFARREERAAWNPLETFTGWDAQTWLNRLGIVLLLLGVGFLFRYSIDRGWLTPLVRVAFGATVGTALTVIGLRMGERRRFASVLLGGGMASFYITGWAAFYLYSLVSYTLAFVAMVAITLAAFGLALRRGQPALAVLGAAGGLGVPLLLGISYASPRGLAAYTSLIVAWTAVPYLRRGWRSPLWTSNAFAWMLLLLYAARLSAAARTVTADRVWLEAAAAFTWLVLALLPMAKRVRDGGIRGERMRSTADLAHWYGLASAPAALLVAVSASVWRMSALDWGTLAMALAALYAAGAWALWRRDVALARVLVFAGSALFSVGSLAALSGEVLLAVLAVHGLALHVLAARGGGTPARWMAHKLAIGTGLWTLYRLLDAPDPGMARIAGDALVLACAFAASYAMTVKEEAWAYRLFVHVAGMGLVLRELAGVPGGQGIATIAWGAYAIGLLVLASKRRWVGIERLAIATVLATVGKLFLVDLARLDALFRVLLFLGFGAVFLALSYSLAGWWRSSEPGAEP